MEANRVIAFFLGMIFAFGTGLLKQTIVAVVQVGTDDRARENNATAWAARSRLPTPYYATCTGRRCTVTAGDPPTLYGVVCYKEQSDGCYLASSVEP